LPMCHVLRTLKKLDIHAERAADVPLACQKLLNYQCPVSGKILNVESN
jgi:hypothetical protein